MTSTETTSTVEYVDPCPGMKGTDEVVSECGKCLGTGEVNYGNVTFAVTDRSGRVVGTRRTCFDCNGTGKHVRLVKNIRTAERRRVREANAIAQKAADAKVRRDGWALAHADLAERLAAISDECWGNGGQDEMAAYAAADRYGDFIVSLAHQSTARPLTDAQVTAVVEALAKYDARMAAAEAKAAGQRYFGAEGEKFTATGTVVTSMNVDGYAYGSTDRLVIIEGTGDFAGVTFKATGSGATLWETERGDEVEFTATVKAHREYRDVPQTVITRAKIKVLANA